MSLQVQVVDSEDQFAALQKTWDEIVSLNPTYMTVFQSWAYIYNHWRYRKSGNDYYRKLRLYVLYQKDKILAIAPMWLNIAKKGISLRILEFIGTRGLDYLDYIISSEINRQEATDSLIQGIFSDRGWDLISFSELREESARSICRVLEKKGIRYRINQCSTCVGINIPKTTYEYLSMLGKSTRKRLIYDVNRLEKLHNVQLEVHRVFNEEFSRKLECLHKIHQERWKTEEQAGSFPDQETRQMDADINRGLSENGSLCYYILSANDGIVGGLSSAVLGKSIYTHKMSVSQDPRYRRFSPGLVMIYKIVEWAVENSYSVIDLTRGDEPYKYSLGGKARQNYRITICRHRWMESMVWIARKFGKSI